MEEANFGRAYCNRAQRAIALSEGAFGESALNVISVRLSLPDCTAQQAKAAADLILKSADVFSAKLCVEGEEPYFVLSRDSESCRAAGGADETGGKPDCRDGDCEKPEGADEARGPEDGRRSAAVCRLAQEMDCRAEEEYTQKKDCTPLNYPEQLYEVEAIPIREGGCVLYARFHHIIMDGYGMSLFAQKTLDALEGRDPESSFFFRADETGEHGTEKEFWQNYFSEAQFEPAVFADTPQGLGFTRFHRTLSGETVERTECFGKENGVTTPYVFAAAYAVWLAEATGKQDAVFLMPRLNRQGEELKTLGCYTLLVPVRVRVEQTDTFGAVCRRTAEAARLASEHKEYGYENILQAVREENPGAGSLSEYVFNFYRYELQAGMDFSCSISVAGAMHNHFTWNIFRESNGGLNFEGRHLRQAEG